MTTQFIWRPLLIIGVCFWLSSSIQAQVSGATVAREGVVKGRVLDENRASEMTDETVLLKARAATLWCQHASTVSEKPWHYVLIPHDAISQSSTFRNLTQRFTL